MATLRKHTLEQRCGVWIGSRGTQAPGVFPLPFWVISAKRPLLFSIIIIIIIISLFFCPLTTSKKRKVLSKIEE